MSRAADLRARAERLLSIARDMPNTDFAARLTALAAEYLERATALEASSETDDTRPKE
jgi:hypothetical protein